MLILTFVLDIFFEFFIYLSGISSGVYAVLYVRYLFAGALGVYLAISGPRFTRWTAIGGIVGFVYLTLTTYMGLFSDILQSNIEGGISHAPAYFWTIVLAVTGFILFPKKVTTGSVKILEIIGKSSWHIFLVQMTFFYFSWQWVQIHLLFPLQLLMPRSIDFLVIPVGVVLTITICCSLGCIWYAGGEYLQKTLSKTPMNPE